MALSITRKSKPLRIAHKVTGMSLVLSIFIAWGLLIKKERCNTIPSHFIQDIIVRSMTLLVKKVLTTLKLTLGLILTKERSSAIMGKWIWSLPEFGKKFTSLYYSDRVVLDVVNRTRPFRERFHAFNDESVQVRDKQR